MRPGCGCRPEVTAHAAQTVHRVGRGIARERIDHPWQEYAWRPVSVFLNAPEVSEWRELRRDAASTYYHAATLPLELHAKDTMGYVANLNDGEPSVYVVLREGGAAANPFMSRS